MTILVVFCPCALVLATPTAIMAAIGNATKHSFLVREGDALERLAAVKKIIGQVQAIDRMIDEDVPCEDILSQINAAKSALHGCGKVVLEGHIKHCVRDGIEHGDADKTIENFTKAVERFSNMG